MNQHSETLRVGQVVWFLIFGLLGILLQGTLVRLVFPNFILPALPLIIVIYLAFCHSSPPGALVSFLLGLQYDLYSGALIGPWAGSFVVVFAFFALLTPRIFVDSPLVTFLVGFFASLGASAMYILICFLAPGVPVASVLEAGHMQQLVLEALAMALCTPFVFSFLLKRVASRSEKQMTYAY